MAAAKALGEYRRKRDFRRTPEPSGRGDAPDDGFFMVHKHAARRLHYDLRLAIGGTLKSWAVPRGPSMDPMQKRLAVHVEDHPLSYADFEGTIPAGNYGAGTVIVWDRGTFGVVGEGTPAQQLADGRLHLLLAGEKLRGAFMLVKTRGRGGDAGRSWLLMKKRDAFAASTDVTTTAPASVRSGLTIEGLRGDVPETGDRPRLTTPVDAEALMHPTLVDAIPSGSGWLFEIKWDGVRVLVTRTDGNVRLHARSGIDVTVRYPEITEAFARVPGGDLAMDGEIVALDPEGRPSFALLAERMHRTPRPGAPAGPAVTCYVFDCLALDGRDVRGMPLVARKALCRERIPRRDPLRYCDHVDHGGDAFLRAACAAALEGVVAKRSGSVYRAGRSREWLKVKCTREESFVIGGWTDPSGTRGHLGALHVGEWRDGALTYAGKVGSGFDQNALATLARALEPLETEVSPFTAGEPPRGRTHHWVEPQLRCRVRYVERTPDGRLRHPVFMGLDAGGTPPPRARSTTPRRPPSRR